MISYFSHAINGYFTLCCLFTRLSHSHSHIYLVSGGPWLLFEKISTPPPMHMFSFSIGQLWKSHKCGHTQQVSKLPINFSPSIHPRYVLSLFPIRSTHPIRLKFFLHFFRLFVKMLSISHYFYAFRLFVSWVTRTHSHTMTEQQNETAPATTEEKAPELPTTEPPTEDTPQVVVEIRMEGSLSY